MSILKETPAFRKLLESTPLTEFTIDNLYKKNALGEESLTISLARSKLNIFLWPYLDEKKINEELQEEEIGDLNPLERFENKEISKAVHNFSKDLLLLIKDEGKLHCFKYGEILIYFAFGGGYFFTTDLEISFNEKYTYKIFDEVLEHLLDTMIEMRFMTRIYNPIAAREFTSDEDYNFINWKSLIPGFIYVQGPNRESFMKIGFITVIGDYLHVSFKDKTMAYFRKKEGMRLLRCLRYELIQYF